MLREKMGRGLLSEMRDGRWVAFIPRLHMKKRLHGPNETSCVYEEYIHNDHIFAQR